MKPSLLVCCVATATLCLVSAKETKKQSDRNYYIFHVPSSSEPAAKWVAHALGAQYEGQVGELSTYYLISAPAGHSTKRSDAVENDAMLVAFQTRKQAYHTSKRKRQRQQRDPGRAYWDLVQTMERQVPRQRVKRVLPSTQPPKADGGATLPSDTKRILNIHDPGFSKQWHLVNQETAAHDINVTEVWRQGITGKGSVVAILDDGLDYDSRDLKDSFYAAGSFDFNDHVELPKPKLSDDTHGTRCAGQIAAQRNDVCGVGIAYDAKVAGIRILSAEITDADEAAALNYKFQENDIYSCSWGPPDNGEEMQAPHGILADAFVNGIDKGRGGKGSIFVFATGNGGALGDNCNFDGYTNSIYTITVGAIDHLDQHPSYAESCSAQMVVTYSSGGGKSIYTTDVGESVCSDQHGGTSAAAPTAAGIFALVLSARPELTWRDLQHLCVQTAVPVNTKDSDWTMLPSHRLYNHKFGYGKLDASAIVEAAKTHRLVNKQTKIQVPVLPGAAAADGKDIPDSSDQSKRHALDMTVSITPDMVRQANLKQLEHVVVTVNIDHERRGDLVITLRSPHQVESELATQRPMDASKDGIRDWKFMSVKHWQEDPVGDWSLLVYDVSHPEARGKMLNWTLTLYGEAGDPPKHQLKPKSHLASDNGSRHVVLSTMSVQTESPEKRPLNRGPMYAFAGLGAVATLATSLWIQKRRKQNAHGASEQKEEGAHPTSLTFSSDDVDSLTSDDNSQQLLPLGGGGGGGKSEEEQFHR